MPAGRPTVMTEAVLRKLEEAFAIGATDKEACFYADISPTSLYEYQDRNPKFAERKDALKERPVLLARQTVVKNLESNPELAFKFLERKRRAEFAQRQELTGADGERLGVALSDEQAAQLLKARADR